jgi:peptidoglycan hydrolase-like protein with peptidoglycan-binding domain
MPDLAVRQAQLLLTFLGFAPGVIDGVLGKRTRSAVVLFRQQQGLGSSDAVNGPLLDALAAAVNLLPA